MQLETLKKEIRHNIGSSTSNYREQLSRKIIASDIPLEPLMDILLEAPPVSTRFSWLLGDISSQSSNKSKEIIRISYRLLPQVKVAQFERVLSKQIMICGHDLPKDLEGIIVNNLFDWLVDPCTSVSTKSHCLFALENLCQKYPELTEEFITCLNDQKDLYSKDFQKRAEKVLRNLANAS